ncbi:olfactory receptor 5P81-like [Gastrophryne carolinensis]
MAYDRYMAICNPLRYSSIMNFTLLLILSIVSWLSGFFFISITAVNILTLDFCGPNTINHFFCDLLPILQLSCSDTSTVKTLNKYMSFPCMIIPLLFTGTSYGCIIKAILSLSSNIDRWKVFSTCGSHLSVVCIFYGTVIAIYVLPPKGFSLGENKAVPLLYTAVTPMLNPIIYSLRNKEIKNAITVLLQRQV